MSDYVLLIDDTRRLHTALQAEGFACSFDRGGALVTYAPLARVREIAAAAGVRVVQTWPPVPRLPADARPGGPRSSPQKEEQP